MKAINLAVFVLYRSLNRCSTRRIVRRGFHWATLDCYWTTRTRTSPKNRHLRQPSTRRLHRGLATTWSPACCDWSKNKATVPTELIWQNYSVHDKQTKPCTSTGTLRPCTLFSRSS